VAQIAEPIGLRVAPLDHQSVAKRLHQLEVTRSVIVEMEGKETADTAVQKSYDVLRSAFA
jgi:hypothetical protein